MEEGVEGFFCEGVHSAEYLIELLAAGDIQGGDGVVAAIEFGEADAADAGECG